MILITEFMDEDAVATLAAKRETRYMPDLAGRQEDIPSEMAGVRALIVRNLTQVTEALLEASPDLVVVGRLGVGLDNIDLKACAARNVEVIPATGANNLSVAEYVITTAFALLRSAYLANARMLNGEWPRMDLAGREISGKSLGLVGFGAIAQETARLAMNLGMSVRAYDPYVPEYNSAWHGVERTSLEKLLESSDIVSLHVPLVENTRRMIDTEALERMKPGAVLINAARGGVVDEEAIADALRKGDGIGGAGLDVFETEPLTKEAAQIFVGVPNLILTPHIAGVTTESNQRVGQMISEKVLKKLEAA